MNSFKKILSIALVLVMLIGTLSAFSFAIDADYDTNTPVIVIHGIGQNNTYCLDGDGNRMTDSDGKFVTGWPLSVDIGAAVGDILPNVFFTAITRQNLGLTDKMEQAGYDLLYAVHKDAQGNSEYPMEIPRYNCSYAEIPKEERDHIYKMIPIRNLGSIIGEDNLFYFGYDSLGDIDTTTDELHAYIHDVVLPKTGAQKVNICPVSLGGTLSVSYLEKYKEDYSIIKKIVSVVPAVNGSEIVGELLVGNLSTYDDKVLFETLLPKVMGDTYTTYLVNMLLRIIPSSVLKDCVASLAKGVVKAAIQNCTQLWTLCPDEYYEEARELWLSDSDHDALRAKVDAYMQARHNFADNVKAFIAQGGIVDDICGYGLELFPICSTYKTTNSDGIIQSSSTSMGATFADLGETLGDDYVAAGTNCNNPNHNHISPENVVDASTCILPDNTWFYRGQSHEDLANDDAVLALATEIIVNDNMTDVYSDVENYPQFNGNRSVGNVSEYLAAVEGVDVSTLSPEDAAELSAAVAQVNELLKKTNINDTQEWEDAEKRLYNISVKINAVESSEASKFEKFLTCTFKFFNQSLNRFYRIIKK